MEKSIPDRLRKHIERLGSEGSSWLSSLPDLIDKLENKWSIQTGPAFSDAGTAWVAPATLEDGSPAVIKIGVLQREARFEAEALRAFGGRSAVRLIRATDDGSALLLERCLPGTNLWNLPTEDMNFVAAEVLTRLWDGTTEGSFEHLAVLVDEWARTLPAERLTQGYEKELLDSALSLGSKLASTQTTRVLLHGDFQPFNVLAAEREPWLAIDPDGLIGDPAYDLAQYLGNLEGPALREADPVAAMQGYVEQFAGILKLDAERIAGWAFAKSIGWNWGMATASLLQNVAAQYE